MKLMIAGHEFARYLTASGTVDGAVIINDPADNYQTIQEIKLAAIDNLYLEFFDLDFPSETHRGPQREDIEKALDWYAARKTSLANVVVTCTAGIARSAATAFVLGCSDQSPEEAAKVWNVRVHYPNRRVVKLGSEILDKPEMIEVCDEFWEERLRRRRAKGKPVQVND